MDPRRIVFIAGQLVLGGAEQQLYHLLAGLDRSRFEPVVITLGTSQHEYWEEPIQHLKIPLCRVPRNTGRLERTFRIAAQLRRMRPHIVHSWVFHTNAYAAVAGSMAHTSLRVGSMRESYTGLPNDRFLRWIGFRGLDALVTNASQTAIGLERLGLTRTKVKVVPNGATIPDPVSAIQRKDLKKELGFEESDLVVGTIGRLDSNKNHQMLMRSFAKLATDWPMLRLLIIGDGPLKNDLQSMAERMGVSSKVKLAGRIPGAARFLSAMEICCLTSHTEGMPNLVMEAGAAGVPVIATRCGDVADLVDDSVSGFLVDIDDDTRMKDHINFMLSNPDSRMQMGQMGRKKIRDEYSLGAMISRMTTLYDELFREKLHA